MLQCYFPPPSQLVAEIRAYNRFQKSQGKLQNEDFSFLMADTQDNKTLVFPPRHGPRGVLTPDWLKSTGRSLLNI